MKKNKTNIKLKIISTIFIASLSQNAFSMDIMTIDWGARLKIMANTIQNKINASFDEATRIKIMELYKELTQQKSDANQRDKMASTTTLLETKKQAHNRKIANEKAPEMETACALINSSTAIQQAACFQEELKSAITDGAKDAMLGEGAVIVSADWYEKYGENAEALNDIVWGDEVPEGPPEVVREMTYNKIKNGNLNNDPRTESTRSIMQDIQNSSEIDSQNDIPTDNSNADSSNADSSNAGKNENTEEEKPSFETDASIASKKEYNETSKTIEKYVKTPVQLLMDPKASVTNQEASNILKYKDLILPPYMAKMSISELNQEERVGDYRGMAYKSAYDNIISEHVSNLVGETKASERLENYSAISKLSGLDLDPKDPANEDFFKMEYSKSDTIKSINTSLRMSIKLQYDNYIKSLREENALALQLAAKINGVDYKK